MTVDSAQLLRRLNPAVQPSYAAPVGKASMASIDTASFDVLLQQASRGQIISGRQIDVACEMQPALDASQLERLASAADQAEAQGFKRALMMIDGRAVVLDVASRTIEAEVSSPSAAAVHAVDAAMRVNGDVSGPSTVLKPPGAGVLPPSIAKQFL